MVPIYKIIKVVIKSEYSIFNSFWYFTMFEPCTPVLERIQQVQNINFTWRQSRAFEKGTLNYGGEKMKKLAKKIVTINNTLEAYDCQCSCSTICAYYCQQQSLATGSQYSSNYTAEYYNVRGYI